MTSPHSGCLHDPRGCPDIIRASAEIVRADGRRCVTAEATFVVLDAGHAADAAGEYLDENLAGYIADS
jgi:hypothetical protein